MVPAPGVTVMPEAAPPPGTAGSTVVVPVGVVTDCKTKRKVSGTSGAVSPPCSAPKSPNRSLLTSKLSLTGATGCQIA